LMAFVDATCRVGHLLVVSWGCSHHHPRPSDRSRPRPVFRKLRSSTGSPAPSATQAACLARSSTKHGSGEARAPPLPRGRIVDLGGGHGLLAQALLVLDDSSPGAIVVDRTLPPSAAKLHEVLVQDWAEARGQRGVGARRTGPGRDSRHGPRRVVPRVRQPDGHRARQGCVGSSPGRRPAVLPPSQDRRHGRAVGWVDCATAIDIVRAVRLTGTATASGLRPSRRRSRRRTGCSSARRRAAPLSERRAQRSVKFTVTVKTTGTAIPFRRVGVNSHWRTASMAA